MDPVTAFFNFVTSLNTVVSNLLEGSTPEQRQQLLQIYLDSHAHAKKFFHIDG